MFVSYYIIMLSNGEIGIPRFVVSVDGGKGGNFMYLNHNFSFMTAENL